MRRIIQRVLLFLLSWLPQFTALPSLAQESSFIPPQEIVGQEWRIHSLLEQGNLKDQFLMSAEAVSLTQTNFDRDKGKFVDKVTQLTFMPWLKKKITPEFDQKEFELWLQKKV